jgi:hypothetical protein
MKEIGLRDQVYSRIGTREKQYSDNSMVGKISTEGLLGCECAEHISNLPKLLESKPTPSEGVL